MIQLESREYTQAMKKSAEHTPETSTSAKVVPVTSRVCHWLTSVIYPLGRRIVIPFYFRQLKVTGQENIPKTGSVILAPTHRSRWDALLIPYAAGKPVTGRDLRFMVSEDEVKGIQGWFIRRMGGFPVNTRHPGIGSIRHSVELLRNGEALVMFPEGNIFRETHVQPLKFGEACAIHYHDSRTIAGFRLERIGWLERSLRTVVCVVMAPLLFVRTVFAVSRKRRHRGWLLRSMPMIGVLTCCRAAGALVRSPAHDGAHRLRHVGGRPTGRGPGTRPGRPGPA